MNIAQAPAQYDKTDQDRMRGELVTEDKKNLKMGGVIDKLVFRDTTDGTLKTVVVTSGAVVIT